MMFNIKGKLKFSGFLNFYKKQICPENANSLFNPDRLLQISLHLHYEVSIS